MEPVDRFYRVDMAGIPELDEDEERDLAMRIANGDLVARARLIEGNLSVVVVTVSAIIKSKGLAKFSKGSGFDELISEGNIALLRAAESFDASFDTKFGDYAKGWVKDAVYRAVRNQGYDIPLTDYAQKLLRRWKREESRLRQKNGSDPTVAEISSSLNWKESRVRIVLDIMRTRTVVRDHSNDDGDSGFMSASIAISGMASSDKDDCKSELLAELLDHVNKLDRFEGFLVKTKFGIDGHPKMPMDKAAKLIGYSKDYAREILALALSKLAESLR